MSTISRRFSRMLLMAFLALLPHLANAATISGSVTDAEDGAALPYSSVVAQSDAVSRGAAADESGFYSLRNLPLGSYTLKFSRIGYSAFEIGIEISEEREYSMDAVLEPKALKIGKVTVSAELMETEREIQAGFVALRSDELRSLPAVGEPDPIRILQQLPGVQAASDVSSGLYIRGGGPDQTLILLDQVPVYNPTHAFGFFSTFNADVVNEVNLYKGAYPARYGGRLGAVVDVENREGSKNGLKGRVGLSTISGRATLEGPLGSGSWIVSTRRTYLEPILDAVRNEDNQIPDYYFYDANGKVVFEGRENGRLENISAYRGLDDLRLDLDQDSFVDLRWGNQLVSAEFDRFIGDNALLSLLLSSSEYKTVTELRLFSTPITFENRIRDYSLRGELNVNAGPAHDIRAGLVGTHYDFRFEDSFNDDQGISFRSQPYDLSVYMEDDWSPNRRNVIRTGFRARYFSDGNRFLFEPRIAASRLLGDNVRLKASGGIYHQYVQLVSTEGFSAADFYLPIDDTIRPGRSWQSLLGVEWDASPVYRLSSEVYYTRLEDLVLLDNSRAADQESAAAADIFREGGRGHAAGMELFLEKRTGPLTGWLGYGLGFTRRTFDDLNQGRSFAPKYDRRHDIKAAGTYRLGPWTYGASFVYGTGQAFTPASARYAFRDPATGEFLEGGQLLASDRNSARLLPYHRLDVSVTRDFSFFGKRAQWVLQIFNLYSRRNEWFVQYDADDPTRDPKVVKMLPVIPSLGINVDF